MMRVALPLAALLAACNHAPAQVAGKEPSSQMEARTDLQRLRRYFEAPAATQSARWIVLPRGMPSAAPGPTDTILWAFVALPDGAWAELGTPGTPATVSVPKDVAQALLPTGAEPIVTGPSYDVAARVLNPYGVEHAIRTQNGLLLELYSH